MAKKEVKKTNKKDKNDKNKKTFFKSFKTELKKVVWPTPKQLLNNTVTVISIVIICAAIVFVLDLVFETLNKQGIERIRDAVVVNEDNTANNANAESSTTDDANIVTVQEGQDGTDEAAESDEATEDTTESASPENGEETVTE